ncbi:MAG: ATP-binding protein [Candidatus Helarchaeales archaeon]
MAKRVVAIVGKGGVGKTIFTGLLLKNLINTGKKQILMIDADPTMSHLTKILGLHAEKNIESIRNEVIRVAARKDEEEKLELVQNIEYKVLEALIEKKHFSLLALGQPETAGCFCPANTMLREVIERFSKSFDLMIIDCEAGLEQINLKVIRIVDTLLIISDTSFRSDETAHAIKKTARKFTHSKEMHLIINKVMGNVEPLIKHARENGLEIIGLVPLDENIMKLDFEGKTILEIPDDAPSLKAVQDILKKIDLA